MTQLGFLKIFRTRFTALTIGALCLQLNAAERPNVVILFTDDQGTIDVNCYGSTDLRTPNIDRLAATGVRFTQVRRWLD